MAPHPNAHPSAGAYSNAAEIAADLRAVGAAAQSRAREKVDHHAMLLETRVKAAASGRPGPRAPSGDYRRSWTTEPFAAGSLVGASVGTDKPQGRRLEYGFVGPDRLGRVYNQPPFPHLQPALDATTPEFEEAMKDLGDWT
ncbi:hypothetical protein [Aeromicrobium sp. Leaf291]|uniref:hypothetical protein n=1 Tax=Aeromicrobium sp. Leaf291 TaxID=1736325 RepID=UPI0006FD1024|nr:hypothetical protein [Aeromicrobium sp. Leaf291]KQP81574.1 hypothetical protein ASF35_16215 [Aeromicrobium sp. Leaf291]